MATEYMYPRTAICDTCGKQFIQHSKDITTCTPCLLHPSTSHLIKERILMESPTRKEKICGCGCGTKFVPTGNCQKYAKGHKKPSQKTPPRKSVADFDSIDPTAETRTVPATLEVINQLARPIDSSIVEERENSRILSLLVATGIVTREKVDAARELIS